MVDGGLLSNPLGQQVYTADSQRRKQVKRREQWLIILGIVIHAVYMLSIFDIYFKSPIVHGIDLVHPRFPAPAKRLVLLIADGLRADKFFELDSEGKSRAPFLRDVIKAKGRWGISHARPPTESRPGHVAIIAGFYEDPSAVTKGWKANPVEFDSVFNRSKHTFAFGSPDIVPIFCGALPHCTWFTYSHHFEDFSLDASFLDEWSFDQFHKLLNNSSRDAKIRDLLEEEGIIIFLHLLGCDTNGHAHRPSSSIYLNNVKVVDNVAESVYHLVEDYFKDKQTAYIFTADHGMSDKGSHGDGHPTNTDTPLVVWGSGIKDPSLFVQSKHIDDGVRFVDEHEHDMQTPVGWGLENMQRIDVNQADISPLMATLVGLPSPVHSVGSLPLNYIKLEKVEEVEAALTNAKQILNQFLRKSHLKQSNSLYFKPFKPLANYSSILAQIEEHQYRGDYETALKLTMNLRHSALAGLHYFQTYDWMMLMTVVTLGYTGWIFYIFLHVLKSYTHLMNNAYTKHSTANPLFVHLFGLLLLAAFIFLYFQHSPPAYYVYFAMTIFLWMALSRDLNVLRMAWSNLFLHKSVSFAKLCTTCAVSAAVLEFLVTSFSNRVLYTWCFLVAGLMSAYSILCSLPRQLLSAIFGLISCCLLSVFTLLPTEIPDQPILVVAAGTIVIVVGIFGSWLSTRIIGSKYWGYVLNLPKNSSRITMLISLQVFLVGVSCTMAWLSTSHRSKKQELLLSHQLVNWFLAGFPMVLPLFSPNSLFSRLLSIFLGFAPPFLLLSIGYEALFYVALSLALMGWLLTERALTNSVHGSATKRTNDAVFLDLPGRVLHLSDVRVPLIFLIFFNVAFFGTGNFASIASFEISSVYRFVTIFNPFLMAALLIFKLLIPFFLVICVFSAITKLIQLPLFGCYFLVILFSDIMTIHFFFKVKNTGSWMEIGNSISQFGVMSAQIVFVLLLFALTRIYTKNMHAGTSKPFLVKEF